MTWRPSLAAARQRYLTKYAAPEVAEYGELRGLGNLDPSDQDAYLSDLAPLVSWSPGMQVLDVGAGTGTMCQLLSRLPGLSITALEPAPAMLDHLRSSPGLSAVKLVQGFCDGPDDGAHFPAERFDRIVSRQVVSSLYDPLVAFEHWRRWLVPGGQVVVIDGLFGRDGWRGEWAEEVDTLPLSGCDTTALTPYLLQRAGFVVSAVQRMEATNALPITRTPRYVVVAHRPPSATAAPAEQED